MKGELFPGASAGFAAEALREAYRTCFPENCKSVMEKGEFDLVTAADVAVEKWIVNRIHAAFPGDRILGEETEPKAVLGGRCWAIDPIDGTVNMANGIPIYGMQCALFEDMTCVASALYFPLFDEMYTAGASLGAYRNGERLQVRMRDSSYAIVSFGDLRHDSRDARTLQLRMMEAVAPRVSKVRMFGAACMDFASVAVGRTDAAVLFTTNLWDIGPGILLCREAGAMVLALDGREYQIGNAGVIVTGNSVLATILTKL